MSSKLALGATAANMGHYDNENSKYMIKNDNGGSKFWKPAPSTKGPGSIMSHTGL